MHEATIKIIEVLKERGYRVTRARQNIVDILSCSKQPLSIQQVTELCLYDDTSVYRTIEMLKMEDLIETISILGQADVFAIKHGHHHHIVCTNCHRVAHLPCHKITNPTHLPADFVNVSSHEVTFYGKCRRCCG